MTQQVFSADAAQCPLLPFPVTEMGYRAVAEIGEPERKVRREREDQPSPAMPQPVTVPETVPAPN